MKKTKHYRVIILLEDFGNNKKGTIMRCEAILATRLNDRKISEIYKGELPLGSIVEELEKESNEVKVKKSKKK